MNAKDRCPECGSVYADPNRDVCLECEDHATGKAEHTPAPGGYEARLPEIFTFDGVKRFLQEQKPKVLTDDDDTGSYELSRGD